MPESSPRVVVVAPSDFVGTPVGGTSTFVQTVTPVLRSVVGLVGVDADLALAGRGSVRLGTSEIPYRSLGVVPVDGRGSRRASIAWLTWRARREIAEMDADVFYVHSAEMALALADTLGERLVYHIHDGSWSTACSTHWYLRNALAESLFAASFRYAAKRSCAVFGVSDEWRTLAESVGRPFTAVPTCVDVDSFAPREWTRGDVLRMGFVGRAGRVKNLPLLVSTLAELRTRGVDATLTVLGDGPVLPDIEALSEELGVRAALFLPGMIDRPALPDALSRVDVLTIASRWEGLPTAMLEAMACGVPVVAPKLAGIAGVLQNGSNGVFFDAWEPACIADAVLKAWERRDELSEVARRTVIERYSNVAVGALVDAALAGTCGVERGADLSAAGGDSSR